jgi:hypothetical protein
LTRFTQRLIASKPRVLIKTWMGDATPRRGGRAKLIIQVTAKGAAAKNFYDAVLPHQPQPNLGFEPDGEPVMRAIGCRLLDARFDGFCSCLVTKLACIRNFDHFLGSPWPSSGTRRSIQNDPRRIGHEEILRSQLGLISSTNRIAEAALVFRCALCGLTFAAFAVKGCSSLFRAVPASQRTVEFTSL